MGRKSPPPFPAGKQELQPSQRQMRDALAAEEWGTAAVNEQFEFSVRALLSRDRAAPQSGAGSWPKELHINFTQQEGAVV